jgi:hypothetical protein
LFAFVIEQAKCIETQKDFPPHLDRNRLVQSKRNGADRPDIPGYDLAGSAVTARDRFFEQTILIDESDAQAVDLQFRDIVHGFGLRKLNNAPPPVQQLFLGIRVLETHHGPRKRVCRKLGCRLTADTLRG